MLDKTEIPIFKVSEKLASSASAAANSFKVFIVPGAPSIKLAIAVVTYSVVATFVLLSDADCVVAVTPLVNTPELEVNPPNKVFLVAISTPSTVPVTVTLPVTDNAPVEAVPDVDKFCDPNEGVIYISINYCSIYKVCTSYCNC